MKLTTIVLLLASVVCFTAAAQKAETKPAPAAQSKPASHTEDAGERAYKANCARCHSAPEQIPPRITRAVVMHMRVRASLSAADEKALIHYFAP